MKYALFVLGMILIVVGGYFLFSGSNIIEVERGWASVISGTTALTGGIITLGLAGVVKTLEDLRRLWAAGVERPVAFQEMPVPAFTAVEVPVARDFSHSAAEAISPFEVEVAADEPPLPPAPEVIPNPLPSPSIRERPRLTPQFERSQDTAEPSAAVAALRQRVADDFSLNWPSFNQRPEPAHEPAIPIESAPAEPTPDAELVTPPPLHLDDLDIDEPELLPREAEAAETREPEPEAEPVSAVPAEFATAEADGPSASEAPKPKAIGRYEADGTIYVMFADGSIEAQSAEGTRHFKSMAELKASFHA
jgi:hypothetical protein